MFPCAMRRFPIGVTPLVFLITALGLPRGQGAAPLSALDQYVVAHGYGGAQFVAHENAYRLPIVANGKVGDLTIDTGAPNTIIYRATLGKFGLTAQGTDVAVHGAFGKGEEKVGATIIPRLAMGNCTLINVKAAVLSDPRSGGLYRTYGTSDGLFGLREMIRYGAVLDLANNLLLVHPGGPAKGISPGIRSLLTRQGYMPIGLTIVRGHLQVAAMVNGTPCQLIVDTGAFFTTLDQQFARKARIGGYESRAYMQGLGTNARPIRVSQFPEFKVGDFKITNASVTITELDPEMLGSGEKTGAAGLLGADYLGLHGAIIDLNSMTLYLRPAKR
jgi:predicted aspartyl protease